MNKTKLILGVGGMDGQTLSNFLLSRGDEVVGVVRRSSQPRRYLQPLIDKGLKLIEGDMTDHHSMCSIIGKYKPEHVYAIGAMSHVGSSFDQPFYTMDVVAKGILTVLEAIRTVSPESRMYNAASSEMFGSNYSIEVEHDKYESSGGWPFENIEHFNSKMTKADLKKHQPFQNELTPMSGNSPYGVSKLAAFQMTRLYREAYNLFVCSGILFNHEGIYRSITFVTRKITSYVSRLNLAKSLGKSIEPLKLGNIESRRDWSDARDMVRAMVMLLEAKEPDDYVVGSGKTYSIKEFLKKTFSLIGEDYTKHIEIDQSLFRPCEVDYLRADPTKIKQKLGWKPEISFDKMVEDMLEHDIKRTNTNFSLYGDI